MIPAAFLACALSLPALASGYSPLAHGDLQIFKMLGSFWQEEHRDNGHAQRPIMLIYNPYRGPAASVLRLAGLKVFEMSPLAGLSDWAVQGDLLHSPIRQASIQVAWNTEILMNGAELCAMKTLVAPMGFLIVQLEEEWMHANLVHNGFEHLPFTWRGFNIYRNRGNHHDGDTNGHPRGAGNGHWQVPQFQLGILRSA